MCGTHRGRDRGADTARRPTGPPDVTDYRDRVQIPATMPKLISATASLLRDRGPLSDEEIVDALQEQGLDLGAKPRDTLDEVLYDEGLPFVLPLADGRQASLDALLDGRTFTHRLSDTEVALGFLDASTDLAALSILVDDSSYCHLIDGSAVTPVMLDFDDDVLADRGIPADAMSSGEAWLLDQNLLQDMGFDAGDLIGVTVRADGFELSAVIAVADAPDVPAALAATLVEVGDGEAVELTHVVWLMCARNPALFATPGRPLAELLAAADLVTDGEWVGPPGFDFPAWRAASRIESIRELHDLDEDEALAVLTMTELYDGMAGVLDAVRRSAAEAGVPVEEILAGDDESDDVDAPLGDGSLEADVVRAVLDFLVEPAVASAVLVETIGAGTEGAAALGAFAESVEPTAPRRARPAVRWLRGKALDRLGDALAAEQAYESALELDDYPLALFELARIASDRGDADRGLSLLRRAGAPADDELVLLLERFRPAERHDIARNAPCWCGSGRKYKVCHRNREQLPLADRAAWLYRKAGIYLTEGPWRDDLIDLAEIRAAHQDEALAVYAATRDPLVIDCALFEGGAFAAFLAERGVLLPDDEQLLGEQWLLAERSVWEVEEVRPGSGFRARDLRTGDRVDVRERLGSGSVSTGVLVCARFVPAGDTVQCFGGMEGVPLHERDALLELLDSEPEPAELVRFLSGRFAPPELQNTEGDPLVFCEATLRSPDPAAMAAALDSTYERDEGELLWREQVTRHGMDRTRATFEVDGDQVTVETNSEARQDRVLGALRELQPGLELLRETRTPALDMREAVSRAAGGESPSAFDPDDPMVAEALEQFVQQYEQAWLDDHIPALAGLTPREAAADPTRRPDLIRLLDSFPPPAGPGHMDPARLRAALGL